MTMTRHSWLRFAAGLLLLSFMIAPGLSAQDRIASPDPAATDAAQVSPQQPGADVPPLTGPKLLSNYVEVGSDYLALTDGFGYWAGGYSRAVITSGNNVWNAEVNGQHEFGAAGVYFAAGDVHTFNPDWSASLALGSSIGGFFWPRFRADGFVNKKWMDRKQWVTTFGFGYYAAKDVHRDHSFYVGSTYYFTKPWIVEEGIRFNVSNPGSVFSPAAFVALTEGRNEHHYITVRSGFGKEAYQLTGPTVSLTNFASQTLTVTWRQWVGPNWGLNLVGDFYHSPFYQRGGASFGFFREF